MNTIEKLIQQRRIEYVPKSNLLWAKAVSVFLREQRGKRIGFYGCGGVARKLVETDNSLDAASAFFITSYGDQPRRFGDFRRVPLRDVPDLKPEIIILLSQAYEKEMLENAQSLTKTEKVYTLGQIASIAIQDSAYRNEVESIIFEKLQSQLELIKSKAKIIASTKTPLLCFTAEYLTFSYLKRIKYLKGSGFRVFVIIADKKVNNAIPIEQFKGLGYFDDFLVAEDFFLTLPDLLAAILPAIVYTVPSTSNLGVFAEQIYRKKFPVVVEYWDVKELLFENPSELYQEQNQQQAEEVYCKMLFCSSDGIIIKDSPEVMSALIAKYDYEPKWIHFPAYVSLASIRTSKKKEPQKLPETYRIVYAGNLQNDPRKHAYYHHATILEAVRKVTALGISFDIFNASDNDGGGYDQYLRLSSENPLFFYHFAVTPEELSRRLPDYHFGWFCFDYHSRAVESKFFIETTFGSKISTYIEAGLPVLVSPEQRFLKDFIEKHGIGVGLAFAELGNLKRILDGLDYRGLCSRVATFRKHWSMENNIERLVGFLNGAIAAYE